MEQRGAALDVAQELQSEPLAFAGALDETGHVGDGIAGVARLHNTEVRMQRGERVVRNFRLSRRDGGDQAGLAGGGIANQRDIRHDLELKEDITLPAGDAEKGEARGLALGGREGGITKPTLPAGSHDVAHPRLGEVDEFVALGVLDNGSQRNGKFDLGAVGSTAVVPHALAALFGLTVGGTVETKKSGDAHLAHQHDVAAITTVAAIGPGKRLKLLPLYRDAAVAAVAGTEVECYLVNEGSHNASLHVVNYRLTGKSEPKPARTKRKDDHRVSR